MPSIDLVVTDLDGTLWHTDDHVEPKVLAALTALERLDSDRVLALADGPNDIELLTNAAVRLVPAVAHAAALDLADHVIPAAADGGWAEVLSYLD